MIALTRWARWEMGRRIEVTGVIVYIICERLLKATVLIGGGIAILVLAAHTDLRTLAENAQAELNLAAGTSLVRRLFDTVLARFATHANPIAAAAIAYGALELVEAIGLLMRRRWAEYLVLLATVAFLPLEVDALVHHPSVLKAVAFVLNIAVAVYLVWRKQLFLARRASVAQAA